MHKAKLFKKLAGKRVGCTACQRRCQIGQGKTGFCLTRVNLEGQLYLLTYGLFSAIHLDPIEKKPLYHFYPGSEILSVGSWGCNFRCKQCLNWDCSWGETAIEKLRAQRQKLKITSEAYLTPQALVKLAVARGSPGIAFTYNEPTIWAEYVYETAVLAKKAGLYTVFVSNGSWSRQTLALIGPVIDAANIDFKGWGEAAYQLQGAFWDEDFLKNLVLAKEKYKIHLELTTLVIPKVNDERKDLKAIAHWLVENLGPEVPWHLSRFSPRLAPDKVFKQLPATPAQTLKTAYELGKKEGLEFIYIWATPEGKEAFFSLGDTFCPQCQRLVVKRNGWQPELVGVAKINHRGICRFCGADLYLKI